MLVKQEIARIKLNPGQGGYFDPITRIHLTHGDPIRTVYAGMNTTGLKAAVRSKRISIISGSLGDFSPPFRLVKGKDGKVKFEWTNKEKSTPPKTKKQDNNKKPVKTETKVENQTTADTTDTDTSVNYAFNWNTQLESAPLDVQEHDSFKVGSEQIDDSSKIVSKQAGDSFKVESKQVDINNPHDPDTIATEVVIEEPAATAESAEQKNHSKKKKGKK